jgi:5-methylcytosine-specific restriction endonuclease McrA
MSHSSEYRNYLASSKWQVIRQRALRGARGRCEHCKKNVLEVGWLEVNHKHYRTPFGQEQWPRDMEALCHSCHRKADAARQKRNRLRRRSTLSQIIAWFVRLAFALFNVGAIFWMAHQLGFGR